MYQRASVHRGEGGSLLPTNCTFAPNAGRFLIPSSHTTAQLTAFLRSLCRPDITGELPGTMREIFKRHVQPTAKSIRSRACVRESVLGSVWHVSTGCSNCGCYSSHCIGTGFPEQVCRRGEILTRRKKSPLLYNKRDQRQGASRAACGIKQVDVDSSLMQLQYWTWAIRLQPCKHVQ